MRRRRRRPRRPRRGRRLDRATLAQLLREAGAAHHQAFRDVNGDDPEWPAWYANWLAPRLAGRVEVTAAALAALDAEHRRSAGAGPWPEFYAERLMKAEG